MSFQHYGLNVTDSTLKHHTMTRILPESDTNSSPSPPLEVSYKNRTSSTLMSTSASKVNYTCADAKHRPE